ncbi:MAG: hypothetical protein AABX04_04360 [Nanoarchaeota archaeon]
MADDELPPSKLPNGEKVVEQIPKIPPREKIPEHYTSEVWGVDENSDLKTCFGPEPNSYSYPNILNSLKKRSFSYLLGGAVVLVAGFATAVGIKLFYYPNQNNSNLPLEETATFSEKVVPSPLEQRVEPRVEVTSWLTFPDFIPRDYFFRESVISPTPEVAAVAPSPDVIYSDVVPSSDLVSVVVATSSLEKVVDLAPVVLVQETSPAEESFLYAQNAFSEATSIFNPGCVTEGRDYDLDWKLEAALAERARLLGIPRSPSEEDPSALRQLYETALEARDRIFGKPSAPAKVSSLLVYPENALFELTLQGECCASAAPIEWYAKFTAPESFRKENFMALFHQYVKERGASEFMKDYKRNDYFDVFAIENHKMDKRYCTQSRLFGDRIHQWVGNTPAEVRACVYNHKKCR